MPGEGRIVVLNGVPRAGKSSIARAMQARGPWLTLGVDVATSLLPGALKPGIGLRPGGERPELEPQVLSLFSALFTSIAAHADEGFDVVSDLGLHRAYATGIDPIALLARTLPPDRTWIVSITCDDATNATRRAKTNPHGIAYSVDPAMIARWREAVDGTLPADITVDSGRLDPETAATMILGGLDRPPEALAHISYRNR